MRIIKMNNKDEFGTREQLDHYFDNELLNRDIVGRFNMTESKIALNGPKALFRGEMLLFTWSTELVRIGRSGSEQILSSDGYEKTGTGILRKYPSYFVIDMDALRKPKRRMFQADLDEQLSKLVGKKINTGVQGWNHIDELEAVEDWFEQL